MNINEVISFQLDRSKSFFEFEDNMINLIKQDEKLFQNIIYQSIDEEIARLINDYYQDRNFIWNENMKISDFMNEKLNRFLRLHSNYIFSIPTFSNKDFYFTISISLLLLFFLVLFFVQFPYTLLHYEFFLGISIYIGLTLLLFYSKFINKSFMLKIHVPGVRRYKDYIIKLTHLNQRLFEINNYQKTRAILKSLYDKKNIIL